MTGQGPFSHADVNIKLSALCAANTFQVSEFNILFILLYELSIIWLFVCFDLKSSKRGCYIHFLPDFYTFSSKQNIGMNV